MLPPPHARESSCHSRKRSGLNYGGNTSCLFRGGYDAKLRNYLLENDLIESIIGLPAGLLQHANIPSVILVLNKCKQKEQQSVINFVDASGLGIVDKRKLNFSHDNIKLVVSLAKGEKKKHKLYKAVLLPEIYKNNNNLNIKLYIEPKEEFVVPDFNTEKEKLKEAQKQFDIAQKKANESP